MLVVINYVRMQGLLSRREMIAFARDIQSAAVLHNAGIVLSQRPLVDKFWMYTADLAMEIRKIGESTLLVVTKSRYGEHPPKVYALDEIGQAIEDAKPHRPELATEVLP